jgi:hypothetical protein
MSALVPFSEAVRLDAELVRIGRGASAARLAVGQALEALASSGGHHELGFSSLEAYARERCERTGRWAADGRALARKLEFLPRIRDALRAGVLGWSTAELLARRVSADSELEWLERARGATVRELRALLRTNGASEAEPEGAEDERTRTLTVSATREDGWLFECARKVAESVAGPMTADRLLETLLAEGYSTLLEVCPERARGELYEIERLERDATTEAKRQADFCAERRREREEAEELWRRASSETRARVGSEMDSPRCEAMLTAKSPEGLDREIRCLCAELAERDLALGIVAESARRAEVWRRLGFVSEAQYACERVGVSLSSLKAKRILAARAGRLRELASALATGRLGYEAAYLLSRVATASTVEAWIRRAEQRTVKHLREEVDAAELMVRKGHGRDQLPLDEASMNELFELERCIASGDLLGGNAAGDGARGGNWAGDGAKRDGGGQMSGGFGRPPATERKLALAAARVRFRFCVRESTARYFRALERVFVRVSSRVCRAKVSFLRFLCENFCRIWLPALRRGQLTESGEEPEYFGVYRRDAFRCSSPVCARRDVTPHHLHFRSRGGGDEDENVATLCVWCHLRGIHEGRLAAEPPASRIQWRIGRMGTLFVDGRQRSSHLPYGFVMISSRCPAGS